MAVDDWEFRLSNPNHKSTEVSWLEFLFKIGKKSSIFIPLFLMKIYALGTAISKILIEMLYHNLVMNIFPNQFHHVAAGMNRTVCVFDTAFSRKYPHVFVVLLARMFESILGMVLNRYFRYLHQ